VSKRPCCEPYSGNEKVGRSITDSKRQYDRNASITRSSFPTAHVYRLFRPVLLRYFHFSVGLCTGYFPRCPLRASTFRELLRPLRHPSHIRPTHFYSTKSKLEIVSVRDMKTRGRANISYTNSSPPTTSGSAV